MSDVSQLSDEELQKQIAELEKQSISGMSDADLENKILLEENKLPEIPKTVSAIRKGFQGAFPLSDELAGVVEATGQMMGVQGAGGNPKEMSIMNGNNLDYESLIKAYEMGRDKERLALRADSVVNPRTSAISEVGGMIASPLNKIVKGMSAVKAGATLGGIYGFGQAEGDLQSQAISTAAGAGGGAVLGKFMDPMTLPKVGAVTGGLYGLSQADKNSPADTIEKVSLGVTAGLGAGYGAKFLLPYAAKKSGEAMRRVGELSAFKSLGGALSDFRNNPEYKIRQIGRFLLDRGLVKFGDSVESIAQKTEAYKNQIGTVLDDIYSRAEELFAANQGQSGFDPKRDKAAFMAQAKKDLGFAVDTEDVLRKLDDYMDFLIEKHKDPRFEQNMMKYNEEKKKYLIDLLQYRKDLKQYKMQTGSDIPEQQLLPGYTDDLQRTGSQKVNPELNGQPPSNMTPEEYEVWTQQQLLGLPQRPQRGPFNTPRGDDLLPTQQQMFLDENFQKEIGNGYQSEILGSQNTPRSYGQGEVPVMNQGQGQMSYSVPPTRPQRPVMAEDVRNPMSPRQAQDVKIALDQKINYNRSPFRNDPAVETGYQTGRRFVNDKILKMIEDADQALRPQLESANKEYGMAATASQIAADKTNRINASNFMGLTDTMSAIGSGAYMLSTGDYKNGLTLILAKKGLDHYGYAGIAKVADLIGKGLLKSPEVLKMAKNSPQAFQAMILSSVDALSPNDPIWQVAAPSPEQQASEIRSDRNMSPTEKAIRLRELYPQ